MLLSKQTWKESDIKIFEEYLKSLAKPDAIKFCKKIINTNYPLLAIPTPTLKKIAKEISHGNWEEFLNLKIFSTYESVLIFGLVSSHIKDFHLQQNYLEF